MQAGWGHVGVRSGELHLLIMAVQLVKKMDEEYLTEALIPRLASLPRMEAALTIFR